MYLKSFLVKSLALLAVMALSSGCGGAASGGTSVWLDVPVDGLRFPAIQSIKIEGHASAAGGVSRVEVWVDGALTNTITDLTTEGTLAGFHMEWAPAAAGTYTIQAIAFGADGTASGADSARVTFGDVAATSVGGCPTPVGGGPTPVSCEAPESGCPTPVGGGPTPVSCPTLVIPAVPIITDTATSPPGALVQFWADPPEIQAGACTTIRWHAENVQKVVFGGMDQPFDGSYQDCLCSDERYSLTVILPDNTEEKHSVDITVNGVCEPPTSQPPQDTTAPPVPSPAVPAEGLSIACKASQNLVWLPVNDESGIARYEVEVQRQSGDNNWQAAPGGSISVADKTTSVPVECGWYYRWRVRAIDGVGNASGWSGWSQFAITLS